MGLGPKISKAVFRRDDWKCRKCGFRDGLHPHHIVYKSKGGTDTMDNIITLCWRCHRDVHEHKVRLDVIRKDRDNLVVKFWRVT